MIRLSVALSLSLGLAPMAFAAAENGGDVIVCSKDAETSYIELVDLHEGKNLYGFKASMGPANLSPVEKVAIVVERNKAVLPNMMKDLSAFAANFESQVMFSQNKLMDVKDSGEVSVPEGCTLEQLVVRHKALPVEGKSFLVATRYWDQISNDAKAAAIMHEFFFGRALDLQGQENSSSSRYLTAALAQDNSAQPFITMVKYLTKSGQPFNESWSASGFYPDSGKSSSVYLEVKEEFMIETSNLGLIKVGAGPLHFREYPGELPHVTVATLINPSTFATAMTSFSYAGEFTTNNGTQTFDNGTVSFGNIAHSNGSMEFLAGCSGKGDAKLVSRKDAPEVITGSLDAGNFVPCAATMSHSLLNTHITAPSVQEFEFSTENFIFNTFSSSEATDLKWDYGHYKVKELGIAVNENSFTAQASTQIGIYPEADLGFSKMKNIHFKSIASDAQNLKIVTTNKPQIFSLAKDLEVAVRDSKIEVGNGFTGKFALISEGTIFIYKTKKMYSTLFNQPISGVAYNQIDGSFDIRFAKSLPFNDKHSYIKEVEYKDFDSKKWVKSTLADIYSNYSHALRFDKTGKMVKNDKNCQETQTKKSFKEVRIKLTKAGKKAIGKSKFHYKYDKAHKTSFRPIFCNSEEGAVFSNISYDN